MLLIISFPLQCVIVTWEVQQVKIEFGSEKAAKCLKRVV